MRPSSIYNAGEASCPSLSRRKLYFDQQLPWKPVLQPTHTGYPPIETPIPLTEKESQDYENMSVDENEEEEGPTEIGQILDELADGFAEPTLRLSEEDIALDMPVDEVVVEVELEEEEQSDSDDDSDDSESGGLAED